MDLENGRNLFRGIMILVAAAIGYWVNITAGLALAVFVGVTTRKAYSPTGVQRICSYARWDLERNYRCYSR